MADLTEWLKNFGLSQYEKKLGDVLSIKSPQDFKQIKTDDDFDVLVDKLGDDMLYKDVKKFKKAWRSIVPKQKQYVYLDQDEKQIQDKLHQRYQDISNDINIVQKAANEFNASVVAAKKTINDNVDKITSELNKKKEKLLKEIDIISNKNKLLFEKKLSNLKNIRAISVENKEKFDNIVPNKDISSLEKLLKLNKLLSMNINNNTDNGDKDNTDNDDDNKRTDDNDNYDNYVIIGDKCVIPGKLQVNINQDVLNQSIDTSMSITCDNNIQNDWKVKQTYIDTISVGFDIGWSKQYFVFTKGNRVATLNKGGWYVIRSVALKPITRIPTVKFAMNGYGYYGIGDEQTEIKDFPGYKKHGWVIKNKDGLFFYDKTSGANCQFSMNPKPPNIQNGKCVEMSFNVSTKKLTVKVDNKSHVSQPLNVDVKKNIYFIWAIRDSGKSIRLF